MSGGLSVSLRDSSVSNTSRERFYEITPSLATITLATLCSVAVYIFYWFDSSVGYLFSAMSAVIMGSLLFLNLYVLVSKRNTVSTRPTDTDMYHWLASYGLETADGKPHKELVRFFNNVSSWRVGKYFIMLNNERWFIFNTNAISDDNVYFSLIKESGSYTPSTPTVGYRITKSLSAFEGVHVDTGYGKFSQIAPLIIVSFVSVLLMCVNIYLAQQLFFNPDSVGNSTLSVIFMLVTLFVAVCTWIALKIHVTSNTYYSVSAEGIAKYLESEGVTAGYGEGSAFEFATKIVDTLNEGSSPVGSVAFKDSSGRTFVADIVDDGEHFVRLAVA